jgi:bifunctional non-homologous end joining protein LigD
MPMPDPMKATAGQLPSDDDGWAYEIKWDGMRVLTSIDGASGAMEMRSSNRIEITQRFPELAALPETLRGHGVVLDGEVVAFDADGHASFSRMQQRMHLDHPGEEVRRAVPVSYLIFDLLSLDGNNTTSLTYEQRRKLLVDLVEPGPSWQVPAHHMGDGAALLAAAAAKGLEGLMAKRLDSPYLPGRRSPAWRKIKVRREQEVVVVGWLPGEGNRSGHLGALLAGVHDPTEPGRPLRFAGRVGTGFSDAELRRLGDRLAGLATPASPLASPIPREIVRLARWVRPELVAQVAFGEWTPDGRMRHPSYLGLRMDKDPSDVVREEI